MLDWLFSSPSQADQRTSTLLARVTELRRRSHFQSDEAVNDCIGEILVEAAEMAEVSVGQVLGQPLYHLLYELLHQEPFLVDIEALKPANDSLQAGSVFREELTHMVEVLGNESERLAAWKNTMTIFLGRLFEYFPAVAFADPRIDGTEEAPSALAGTVPLYELMEDFHEAVEVVVVTMASPREDEKGLYEPFTAILIENLCRISNLTRAEFEAGHKTPPYPSQALDSSPEEVLTDYLANTVFIALFETPITISVPQAMRYEHTHIVAGSGHGKTQTLQYLITNDLLRGMNDPISMVVIDPHGDLIQTLSHSVFFKNPPYAQQTIIIDPADVLFPVGLNLFDTGAGDARNLSGADLRTLETIQNNTLDFFEYFFSSLIGNELTGKQTTLFRYIGILLMQVPDATIHTVIDLMEHGERYKPYIQKLTGSAKLFFDTRFFDTSFRETKKQISVRLFGVLSSQTLDRMFSAKRSKINFFEALQSGTVILVNAAQDYLGAEASKIFIRLMVSLIGQALIRRAVIAPEARMPTYLYIDEAGNVVDETLVGLLSQVRKYKGAITFSHQYLDQVPSPIRAGMVAGTAIKLAGGISHKDAATLAPEYRCHPDFLLGMHKRAKSTEFALYARGITATAMTLQVPFGYLESLDKLTPTEYQALLDHSRELCAAWGSDDVVQDVQADTPKEVMPDVPSETPIDTEQAAPPPVVVSPTLQDQAVSVQPAPEQNAPVEQVAKTTADVDSNMGSRHVEVVVSEFRKEGGGGVKHQYVQRVVKELGEQSGWRVTLEETVLESTGRIDVVARRGDDRILVEVSVTTTREHEYANIKKCLEFSSTLGDAGGTTHILLVATPARHLTGLRKHIEPLLNAAEKALVRFMSPDDLPAFFDALAAHTPAAPTMVKGYKVRSKVLASTPDEAIARRRAVAQVIANSSI
jgi:Helicase HerA, central domain